VLPVPKWLKSNSIYPLGRAAILSLAGSPRFYNPVSAVKLCFPEDREEAGFRSLLDGIYQIGKEHNLAIWHTPLGKLATIETEIAEHIAFLLAEVLRDVYLSGTVKVTPGAIVLDVGANIGVFARKAVSAGAGQVICLEPTPGNVSALRWNLAAEIDRVTIVTMGAWDAVDTVRFTVDPRRPGRSSCVDAPPEMDSYEISIEVAPLDLIVKDLKLPRVDFIKMDIEGAELKALRGAKEIIARHKPHLAIAVEHTADRLRNARQVRELVLSINSTYRCVPGPYCFTDQRRLAPEILYFN
jgi:FkbM family methyltransferase